ncbi:hypothetical protein TrVGV298_007864 [Trichoderma virens]|nr:hypothetical protein TrVGV298_007864 [Trichoderma virens]
MTDRPAGFSIARVITPIPPNEAGEETRAGNLADNGLLGQDSLAQQEAGLNGERSEWQWGYTSSFCGIIRSSAIESRNPIQPAYVVLGIFPSGHFNPKERIAFVHDPEKLFRELRWTIFRLRGWRSSLLSLRGVKRFRLFKCNAEDGTHERIHLDKNGDADLQLLLNMYKRWYVSRHIALAWTNWIHHTLNNGSLDVLNGTYAIELVLDWSATRISIVVLLPLLASLITGICLNKGAWTDLATIQTAWGTASYVVTAGGLLAALLAIVSSIAER